MLTSVDIENASEPNNPGSSLSIAKGFFCEFAINMLAKVRIENTVGMEN
jgi:hypothetical protein